jgi:hypothetical protein
VPLPAWASAGRSSRRAPIPSELGMLQSSSCFATCPSGMVENATLRLCVPQCHVGTAFNNATQNCVSRCPYGMRPQPFSRVCAPACSNFMSLFHRAPNGSHVCVNDCSGVEPRGVHGRDDGSGAKTCQVACPPGQLLPAWVSPRMDYDSARTFCTASTCAPGSVANSTTRSCHFACPPSSGKLARMMADGSVQCVKECPRGTVANETTRVCGSRCSAPGTVFGPPPNAQCTSQCPRGWITEPLTNACEILCRRGTLLPLGASVDASNPSSCVPAGQCPAGQTDGPGRSCVPVCPVGKVFPLGGSTAVDCTYRCNDGTVVDSQSRTCEHRCPSSQVWDPISSSCVSSCPSSTRKDTQTRSCRFLCPSGLIRGAASVASATSADCVTACEMGYAPDWTTHVCGKACPANKFLRLQDGMCHASCLAGTTADSSQRVCRPSVPATVSLATALPSVTVNETARSTHLVTADLTSHFSSSVVEDILSFRILSGNTGGRFVIPNPLKLQLAVATFDPPREQPLDFEDSTLPNPFVLTVQAFNLQGSTANGVLVIEIADVNESPRTLLSPESVMTKTRMLWGAFSPVDVPVKQIFSDEDGSDELRYAFEWFDPVEQAFRPYQELSRQVFQSTFRVGNLSSFGTITLWGIPSYGGTISLQQAVPQSPSRKDLVMRVQARDLAGLSSDATFTIAIEVPGCVIPSAAWDPSRNPLGNYNPHASLAVSNCQFPKLTLPTDEDQVATFSIPDAGGDSEGEGAVLLSVPGNAYGRVNASPVGEISVTGAEELTNMMQTRIKSSHTMLRESAVKLGPAGAQFTNPLELSMYVGVLPPGAGATIMVMSEGSDATVEAAKDCRYAAVGATRGMVTCKLSHFSVAVAVVTSPPVSDATLAGRFNMVVSAGCMNDCNGHGACVNQAQCMCYHGWKGYSCDKRVCPHGPSWPANGVQDPLFTPIECSGKGKCDDAAGQCVCMDGFEGAACSRIACANDCNGHGECLTIDSMQRTEGYGSAPGAFGGYSTPVTMSATELLRPVWEASRLTACVCDPGFQGADCSERICPFGDDPVSLCQGDTRSCDPATDSLRWRIRLWFVTDVTSIDSERDVLVLSVRDRLAGGMITDPARGVWSGSGSESSEAIRRALVTLPDQVVPQATVEQVDATLNSREWTVVLPASRNAGYDSTMLSCERFLAGCGEVGCAPRHPQFLTVDTSGSTGAVGHVVLDERTSISVVGQAQSLTEYDVEVVVTVSAGQPFAMWSSTLRTPSSAMTAVDGASGIVGGSVDVTESSDLLPTPLAVDVGSGVVVRFTTVSPTAGTYVFRISGARCDVSVDRGNDPGMQAFECSRRGRCNRAKGLCECADGFEGASCSRMTVWA